MEKTGWGTLDGEHGQRGGSGHSNSRAIEWAVENGSCQQCEPSTVQRVVPNGRIAGTAVRPPTQWNGSRYLDGVPVLRVVGR